MKVNREMRLLLTEVRVRAHLKSSGRSFQQLAELKLKTSTDVELTPVTASPVPGDLS